MAPHGDCCVCGHAVLRRHDRQHRHRRLATHRAGSGEISAWTTASRNGVGLHKGRGTGLELNGNVSYPL
jgi:hypothetical protein